MFAAEKGVMRGGGEDRFKEYPWLSPPPSLKNACHYLREGLDTGWFARHLVEFSLSIYIVIGQEPKEQIFPLECQVTRKDAKGGK